MDPIPVCYKDYFHYNFVLLMLLKLNFNGLEIKQLWIC